MAILNKNETEIYINEKYVNGLHQDDKIFNNDIIEKIYLTSAGNREAIDILCKQYLYDPAKKNKERSNYLFSILFRKTGKISRKDYKLSPFDPKELKEKIHKNFFWIFGSLIITFASFLYVFPIFEEYKKNIIGESKKNKDEGIGLYEKYNIDLPENKKTKKRGDQPPRLLSYHELMKEFPTSQNTLNSKTLPPQLEKEIPVLTINNSDNDNIFNEIKDSSVEIDSQKQPKKNVISIDASKKSNITSNIMSNSVTDTENNFESNEKMENLKKDINWLISQDSDKYVLQLVSAIKKETIANYLAFFGNTKESVIEFTTFVDGKKRYILLYGPFDNSDLAHAEIEKLPEKARQIKPWVRTIKSIKELVE